MWLKLFRRIEVILSSRPSLRNLSVLKISVSELLLTKRDGEGKEHQIMVRSALQTVSNLVLQSRYPTFPK